MLFDNRYGWLMVSKSPRFYIGESTIPGAGKGLFAKVALAKGDRLEVIGVLISSGSISDECTRYADEYKFRVRNKLLIPLGYGGMVNHSLKQPNLKKVINGGRLFLQATHPVQAGEELFITYSKYARERFNLR